MLQVKIFKETNHLNKLEEIINKWLNSQDKTITIENVVIHGGGDDASVIAVFYKSSLPDGHPHR